MVPGLLELALIVIFAAVLSIAARLLKQPTIVAYIVAGLVVAFLPAVDVAAFEFFELFSKLGIMFLLFLVGLEINYTSLKFVGRPAFLLGLGQIAFTSIIGFFLASFLGFGALESLYIAVALTFSSTIIIVKLLSDKGELQSLHGKISVGFLLVQDFFVILVLVFLAGLQAGEVPGVFSILKTILTGVALFVGAVWLGNKVLPRLFDRIAQSSELLFVVSLAWLFGMVLLVEWLGLSIEIAGFLAGLALANSSEHYQIASRMKPLRDFFILLFFVILGYSINITDLGGVIVPGIILSLFVLVGNPLIVMLIMRFMGYRKRTSFMAGLTVAQISEFSIILAASALAVGHMTSSGVALITFVGVVTISVSTYVMLQSEYIFGKLSRALSVFEKKKVTEMDMPAEGFHKPIVLVGAHRTGKNIAAHLVPDETLIIDLDPKAVADMKEKGFEALYGDISDTEIIATANIQNAELVICTSPSLTDNLTLLEQLRRMESSGCRIVRAETEEDAELLYSRGADYVILPYATIGKFVGTTIASAVGKDIKSVLADMRGYEKER